MTRICAYQFEIRPAKGQASAACFRAVRDELAAWVGGFFAPLGVADVRLTFDRAPVSPLEGHQLRGDERECPTHQLLTLDWERNDPEASLLWRLTARLAADARLVQAAFVMEVLPRPPALRALRFTVESTTNPHGQLPWLVSRLIASGDCRVDGQSVPRRHRLIRKAQVDAFVRQTLCDPRRILPVLVLSLGAVQARPGVLQALQDHVLGLAQVAALADLPAAERMTKLLGYKLSCEEGVRIYYAGFTPQAAPDAHPFQTAEQMAQSLKRSTLADQAYALLAGASGSCFEEGPVLRSARAAFEAEDREASRLYAERLRAANAEAEEARLSLGRHQQRHATVLRETAAMRVELETLRQQVAAAAPPAPKQEALDELAAALEYAWDANAQLQAECQAARREAEALNAALRSYRDPEVAQTDPSTAGPAPSPPDPAAPRPERDFGDTAEALAAAASDFADVLTVWEDARRSAEESRFGMPAKVFQALRAIAEVGRDYFQAQNGGPPLGPIDRAFQARVPFKYTGFESQTTLSKFGSERVFHDGNQSRQMLRHLTLGGGTTNNCLQIYFDFDSAARRAVVGYCGRHLSFSRMRT
jgi:hypothetical protein